MGFLLLLFAMVIFSFLSLCEPLLSLVITPEALSQTMIYSFLVSNCDVEVIFWNTCAQTEWHVNKMLQTKSNRNVF